VSIDGGAAPRWPLQGEGGAAAGADAGLVDPFPHPGQ
jgi:hypothetical protein